MTKSKEERLENLEELEAFLDKWLIPLEEEKKRLDKLPRIR